MSDLSRSRRGVAAVSVVVVLASALGWSAAARPSHAQNHPNAVGSWAFRFDVQGGGGAVTEANIGKLELLAHEGATGTRECHIEVRSNFNGFAHDHLSESTSPTSCTWAASSSAALDGSITAVGLGAEPVVISFVVAHGGQRLLLLLDSAPLSAPAGGGGNEGVSGFVGTGEAFRR